MSTVSSAEPAASVVLSARGLSKFYGPFRAVDSVDLDVRERDIHVFIGPNGAGKSTAFKVIVGLLHPERGEVVFNGVRITGLRPDQVLRQGLAYVPQGRVVFPQMTALENLEMGAYIERDPRRIAEGLERVYRLFPVLRERGRQKAGTLSGGEQQMLAIGRALMTQPRLLLLDEPSLGLSPKFLGLIFEKVAELKASGMTMMLVEQNAAKALAVADRAYVLELGKNRLEGPGPALLGDPEVKRLYLGG
jgi:branched-chain amino acid transport system ATP-binding protein